MDALGNIYDSEHMSIKWIPKVRLYAAPSAWTAAQRWEKYGSSRKWIYGSIRKYIWQRWEKYMVVLENEYIWQHQEMNMYDRIKYYK